MNGGFGAYGLIGDAFGARNLSWFVVYFLFFFLLTSQSK